MSKASCQERRSVNNIRVRVDVRVEPFKAGALIGSHIRLTWVNQLVRWSQMLT